MKKLTLASLTVVVASMCLGIVACNANKRPDQFEQNQGQNLIQLNEVEDKTFSIQTGKEINENSQQSNKELQPLKVSISAEKNAFVRLPLVSYTTDSNLIKTSVPMRGRPDFKYDVFYEIEGSSLVVYKVAAAVDIDKDEVPSAVKIGKGSFAGKLKVALVRYPIKFIKVEKKKNSDNETTHQLGEFVVDEIANATHIRLDMTGYQQAKLQIKANTFPAEYLKGEWYYAQTVVAAPSSKEELLGQGDTQDQNLQATQRVKFEFSENMIKAVNINVDSRTDQTSEVNFATVISIPSAWKDYQMPRKGADVDLEEREAAETNWALRKFVALNFEQTKSAGGELSSTKVVSLEVTNDSFTFVLQNNESNIQIRSSFRKRL